MGTLPAMIGSGCNNNVHCFSNTDIYLSYSDRHILDLRLLIHWHSIDMILNYLVLSFRQTKTSGTCQPSPHDFASDSLYVVCELIESRNECSRKAQRQPNQ
jgi:hypothetical protein